VQDLEQQLQALEERVADRISVAGQQLADVERQIQSFENGISVVDENETERELAAIELTKQ